MRVKSLIGTPRGLNRPVGLLGPIAERHPDRACPCAPNRLSLELFSAKAADEYTIHAAQVLAFPARPGSSAHRAVARRAAKRTVVSPEKGGTRQALRAGTWISAGPAWRGRAAVRGPPRGVRHGGNSSG